MISQPLISSSLCNTLNVQNEVIMFQDRNVVSQSLRQPILRSPYAAHQGTLSMERPPTRSQVCLPGNFIDIQKIHDACTNVAARPHGSSHLTCPSFSDFDTLGVIFNDFCKYGIQRFLLIGDRLITWVEKFVNPTNS